MVNVQELKAAMARKGLTQAQTAEKIGISSKTFSLRLKSKVFGSDEIEKLINILDIADPMSIFFAGVVTCKDTE